MLNTLQVKKMVEMQNKLNLYIDPAWFEKGYNWHRAIMVESVEAIEHHGWKWWKKQEVNLDQIKLEMVDIFHFGLSLYLQQYRSDIDIASAEIYFDVCSDILDRDVLTFNNKDFSLDSDLLDMFDLMASMAGDKRFSFYVFSLIMKKLDFAWYELYELYISKNTLNIFRNDHGYNSGTYQKIWNGKEDNEVLSSIILDIDFNSDDCDQIIYSRLTAQYLDVDKI